jgi:hypothetical protein
LARCHALAVRVDPPVLRVLHLHGGQRPLGGGVRVGQSVQFGVGDDELPGGQEVVHRLAFGHDADVPVHLLLAPDGGAVEGDASGGRGQEARHHVDQGGLARAIGAEQAGHAGADGHGDVVDGHHVAEPARHLVDADHRHDRPTFL